MKRIAGISLLVLLSGCSVSSTFIDRQTGVVYAGRTVGGTYGSQGRIEAVIEGEKVSGQWTYMVGGTSTSGIAPVNTGAAPVVSVVTGSSSAGKGLANLRGDKGSVFRCIFEWSAWTGSGIGECSRSDGETNEVWLWDSDYP